jgi:hypothetical protein
MNIDKILHHALSARRKDPHFHALLRDHKLVSTYKSCLSFYRSAGYIKVPLLHYGSSYQKKFTERKLRQENMLCALNVLLFFLALSIGSHLLLQSPLIPLGKWIVGMASSIGVLLLSGHMILTTQQRKTHFTDLLHANIATLLDYIQFSDQSDIDDEALIQFLHDVKATHQALIIARKDGFSIEEGEIHRYLRDDSKTLEQIARLDNDANPSLRYPKKPAA